MCLSGDTLTNSFSHIQQQKRITFAGCRCEAIKKEEEAHIIGNYMDKRVWVKMILMALKCNIFFLLLLIKHPQHFLLLEQQIIQTNNDHQFVKHFQLTTNKNKHVLAV